MAPYEQVFMRHASHICPPYSLKKPLFKPGTLHMAVRPIHIHLLRFSGHALPPPSTCKSVVSQPKLSELIDALSWLHAENVKRLLKESRSGASSSFKRDAHGSAYMTRNLCEILLTTCLLVNMPLQSSVSESSTSKSLLV